MKALLPGIEVDDFSTQFFIAAAHLIRMVGALTALQVCGKVKTFLLVSHLSLSPWTGKKV